MQRRPPHTASRRHSTRARPWVSRPAASAAIRSTRAFVSAPMELQHRPSGRYRKAVWTWLLIASRRIASATFGRRTSCPSLPRILPSPSLLQKPTRDSGLKLDPAAKSRQSEYACPNRTAWPICFARSRLLEIPRFSAAGEAPLPVTQQVDWALGRRGKARGPRRFRQSSRRWRSCEVM